MQIARYKIRHGKINHILISHLHGDHYFGLIGLLTSMGLLGRESELHLYGPAPLMDIISLQLSVAGIILSYPLHFHPLEKEGLILDSKKMSIECFATHHRIECWGFIIREKKPPRKVDKDKVLQYEIPATFYERLKMGEDYTTKTGERIANEQVTMPNTAPKSYAYSADTIYDERIADKVSGVTLLYHETTYLKDLHERAAQRFHSTTVQAAAIAAKANVGKLLIGHFSSKYETLHKFLEEAKEVFDNTDTAIEGVTYQL
jgi:ribonuclease Z